MPQAVALVQVRGHLSRGGAAAQDGRHALHRPPGGGVDELVHGWEAAGGTPLTPVLRLAGLKQLDQMNHASLLFPSPQVSSVVTLVLGFNLCRPRLLIYGWSAHTAQAAGSKFQETFHSSGHLEKSSRSMLHITGLKHSLISL